MQQRREHGLWRHKEGVVAVMTLVGDMGKARENEDDRKVKTQEGRAGDSWADSFFLGKDIPYVPDHGDQTQSDE